MTVYLDSYTVEAFVSSAWSDITSDVVGSISARWGITGNTAVDNLADTGELIFHLKNQSDLYIPGHASVFDSGWDKNTPVRLTVTYEGNMTIRFRGYVDQLEITSEKFNDKFVRVICVDWMDYAAKFLLTTPAIQTDKRADEAIQTIVDTTPIAPQATDLQSGQETFLTVFDRTSPRSRAYSEFSSLVDSELGYLYVKKDGIYGETLFFEDRNYRNGLRTLAQIPIDTASSDALLMETGDNLLLETGDNILLNQSEDAIFDNSMSSLNIQYGEDVVNQFISIVHPKDISPGNEVLFSLESPLEIGSRTTIEIRTNYSDPTGGRQVNAVTTSMVAPVATTDYLMNTQSDGGGANTTSNLTVVAEYGTASIKYTLTNGDQRTGYITKLQARGIGVFGYNPVSVIQEDSTSITAFGNQPQSVDQRYQQNTFIGSRFGKAIIDKEKSPRIDLQTISFSANSSSALMYAFLSVRIGDLAHFKESDAEIDEYAYVQGISFTIDLGGIIAFTWIVRGSLSLKLGLSLISCEFGSTGETDGIDYGFVKETADLTKRSWSAFIYLHTDPFEHSAAIFGVLGSTLIGGQTGYFIGIVRPGGTHIVFIQEHGAGDVGVWATPNNSISLNTWTHIAVTHDTTTPTNDPIIYINGSAQILTETFTPTGSVPSEVGINLVIGNNNSEAHPFALWFDGEIRDARIYNRILTSGEASTLSGGGDVTSGMVFQTFCVRTKELSDFEDLTLTTQKLIDNIYGAIGTPNGSPITRFVP